MTYAKPELVVSGSNLAVIQGTSSADKGINSYVDNTVDPPRPSNAFTPLAYEADE